MQDPLHDPMTAEQQKEGRSDRQPEGNDHGHYNSGHFRLRAKLRALARLHLVDETFAMKMDTRLKGENKHQHTHAHDKRAFQQVATFQQKVHVLSVIQKR
jgi:hypothetical protein